MTNKQDRDTLSRLIVNGLREKQWSVDRLAKEAKRHGVPKMSASNIRNYLNGSRDRVNGAIIRNFAKAFGQSEESWLAHFAGLGGPPLLFLRNDVLKMQSELKAGDRVVLISSRRFLEADDPGVQKVVVAGLERGLVYHYHFPSPQDDANPYGTVASDSFQQFIKEAVSLERFSRTPLIFGFPVNCARFRYFSDLHTIVHFESVDQHLTNTYAYIELEHTGKTEQAWYQLSPQLWDEIKKNLYKSRTEVADFVGPVEAKNGRLLQVRDDYLSWFKSDELALSYAQLRPVLGHAGDRFLDSMKREIFSTEFTGDIINYLDIGCGDGVLTKEIVSALSQKRKHVSVVCLDVSKAQIANATNTLRHLKTITFTSAVMPFEEFRTSTRFDFITAVHSLYVVDPAYLHAIYGLLAPKGIACIWMARRDTNVVTALCTAVDSVLRNGQVRSTADDMHEFLNASDLPIGYRFNSKEGYLENLLDESDQLTEAGRSLVEFCALQPVQKNSPAWNAAVNVLQTLRNLSSPTFPLHDAFLLIQRR